MSGEQLFTLVSSLWGWSRHFSCSERLGDTGGASELLRLRRSCLTARVPCRRSGQTTGLGGGDPTMIRSAATVIRRLLGLLHRTCFGECLYQGKDMPLLLFVDSESF